jgi:hypothetical protein
MWRRSLWERAGNRVDDSWGIPSDFGLWVQFFRHAQLYPVDALIGGYRLHADAQGWQDLEESHRTHDRIIEKELESLPGHAMLRLFRSVSRRVQQIPALAKPWRKLVLGTLMKSPASDLPRVIRNQDNSWVMQTK